MDDQICHLALESCEYIVIPLRMIMLAKYWETCIVCNVLRGWSREQKNDQQNNAPNPKKQCRCRSESSKNRAFEGCRSTVNILCLTG